MDTGSLLAEDYPSSRKIAGKTYPSIYREYADCVADGIVQTYHDKP
ncbi:MAG: hypothetical protein LBK71_02900 [Verrucomicrobiales bacterium]|nr:hypothetical protein [Verrucomicrobiales bacterium]